MYPFIITTISGFATLLGLLPIFLKIKNINKIVSLSCGFASGVMICVSVLDLIPESFKYLKNINNNILLISLVFISLLLGIIISSYLDKLIDKSTDNNNLFKLGILSMIVIILHNIPEGIVTYIVSRKNLTLGISLCLAIAMHNIPEGISIAIPIYYSTKSKYKAFIYTFISSISELIGAIITYIFLDKYINDYILGILFSLIGGIMLQISIQKLLPTSKKYNNKLYLYAFFIGFIFMLISLIII